MNKIPLEIIIPVFNEGDKVLKLMELFQKNIKNNFRVLFCYDLEDDNIFKYMDKFKEFNFDIQLIKNPSKGPCSAIKEGFKSGNSDCVIVYPADDFTNFNLLDKMYSEFINGSHIVAASRFIEGGSMKDCPLIKSILVRTASFTLYYLSSIPIKDASNGFRLFSRKLLNEINVESKVGFAYSLELLAKCNRLKYKISEIPAQWEERSEGSSRFKVFKWLPQYLKWYIYGLSTTWLRKKKI
jgi:glycosyltransferase involved in cell wall biosynthesis